MVKCSSCGTELRGDFCTKCGMKDTPKNRQTQKETKAIIILAIIVFGLVFLGCIYSMVTT